MFLSFRMPGCRAASLVESLARTMLISGTELDPRLREGVELPVPEFERRIIEQADCNRQARNFEIVFAVGARSQR